MVKRTEPRRGFIGRLGLSSAIAVGMALISHSAMADEEVVVTTLGGSWEAALKKAYYDDFEKETGIKVVFVPENHAKLLASVAAEHAEADVTEINAGLLAGFIEKNAIEKIDYSVFDPVDVTGIPDPMKDPYGVGAVIYSVVLAWNSDVFKGDKAPHSWADFYDISAFPGPRAAANCDKIVDGGLLETALMADGVAPADVYPIDMDRAFNKLASLKPHVRKWWMSGGESPDGLLAGEFDMASAYNGRIYAARNEGAPLDFTWNQSLLQYDYWIVMKNAPNKQNAMKLLAYKSRADRQAIFAEAITYGPSNANAYKHIDKTIQAALPGNPEVVDSQLYQDYAWWNEKNASGKTNWDTAVERCVDLLAQ